MFCLLLPIVKASATLHQRLIAPSLFIKNPTLLNNCAKIMLFIFQVRRISDYGPAGCSVFSGELICQKGLVSVPGPIMGTCHSYFNKASALRNTYMSMEIKKSSSAVHLEASTDFDGSGSQKN